MPTPPRFIADSRFNHQTPFVVLDRRPLNHPCMRIVAHCENLDDAELIAAALNTCAAFWAKV